MCDECDWEEFLEDINDLLDMGEHEWATDTLEGIRETVESMEHCTEAQRQAIENIKHARRT